MLEKHPLHKLDEKRVWAEAKGDTFISDLGRTPCRMHCNRNTEFDPALRCRWQCAFSNPTIRTRSPGSRCSRRGEYRSHDAWTQVWTHGTELGWSPCDQHSQSHTTPHLALSVLSVFGRISQDVKSGHGLGLEDLYNSIVFVAPASPQLQLSGRPTSSLGENAFHISMGQTSAIMLTRRPVKRHA